MFCFQSGSCRRFRSGKSKGKKKKEEKKYIVFIPEYWRPCCPPKSLLIIKVHGAVLFLFVKSINSVSSIEADYRCCIRSVGFSEG